MIVLIRLGVVLGATVLFPGSISRLSQDVAERVISGPVEVSVPLAPCEAASAAGIIAVMAEVPAGIEHAPGACDYRSVPTTRPNRRSLHGLSVKEALDLLVQLDPRYRWTISEGVISFRPAEAVARRDHFLHTATGSLELTEDDLGGALAAVAALLGDRYVPPPAMRTAQAMHRFTLRRPVTSVVEALDAIVRTHGTSWWEVRYCQPTLAREFATLTLWTFDKAGLGVRLGAAARRRGQSDPCARGAQP